MMDKYLEVELEVPMSQQTGGTSNYNDLENKPQINGVALEGNKTPGDLKISTSQLENNGDGSSPFATEEYVNTNGGKIDVIEVNGEAQTITDKKVNIVIDKNTVGLGKVDNTSDVDKPVSIAQQSAIDAVQSNLDDETTRATNEEKSLFSAIENETTRAKKAEEDLDDKITTETSRASEMEASLQTKLNTEIADRKSGDSGLSTRIDNEVSRAKGVEGTLRTDLDDEVTRATNAENANTSAINGIKALIPNQASSTNQLADKEFVNSSVNAVAATFRGNFATKAALDAWQTANPGVAKKNDYAIVQQDETHSNQQWRYLYQDDGWEAQYKVNDAPFTEAQNKAINSGATKEIIDSVGNKLDKSDVLDASGTSTTNPISQNAATQLAKNVQSNLKAHIEDTTNPHSVTKEQVGLGNVDNTSDTDKPVSTAQQTALDGKLDKVTSTTTLAQVYVKNANGTNQMYNLAQSVQPYSIVQRESDGRVKGATATDDADLVPKAQMDTALGAKLNAVTGASTDIRAYVKLANGTQSTLSVGTGANAIAQRTANGKLTSADVAEQDGEVVILAQLNYELSVVNDDINTAETNAKSYADTKAASTLSSAKSYTDTAIADAITTTLNTAV